MDRAAFLALVAAIPAARDSPGTFAAADRLADGGLGVAVVDRATGRRWQLRAGRRFRLGSVAKLPLAAYVWDQIAAGEIGRGSAIPIRASDVRPGPGTTEAESSVPPLVLVGRMLRDNDNTAADVLLRTVGGAVPVNRWLVQRSFDIRLSVRSGDAADVATPAAMAAFLDLLVHGDLLGSEATSSIMAEMESSTTGRQRLRAGLPPDWTAGDKTGTSEAATSDVGFVVAPRRQNIAVVAAFVEAPPALRARAESALAAVGRILPAIL